MKLIKSSKRLVNPANWSSYLIDIGHQSRGNVVAQLLNILAMPLVTRLYSPDIFGKYALASQLIAGASIILSLRLEYFIVSNSSLKIAIRHLRTIIRNSLIALIILGFLILIFKNLWKSLLNFTVFEVYLILFLAWITNISLALQNFIQFKQNFKKSGNSEIWNKGAFATVALILGAIHPSLVTYLLGFISGFSSKVFYLYTNLKFELLKNLKDLSVEKEIRKKAYSLSIVSFLQFFVGFIPIYYLNKAFELTQVGYFNIATTLLFLPVAVIGNAIGQVYFQRVSLSVNSSKLMEIYKLTRSTIFASLSISFFIFSAAYILSNYIHLFLGNSWKDSAMVIKLFCFSSFFAFNSICIDKISFALRKNYYPILFNILRLISVCLTIYYADLKRYNFIEFIEIYVFQLCIIYSFDMLVSLYFAKTSFNSNL